MAHFLSCGKIVKKEALHYLRASVRWFATLPLLFHASALEHTSVVTCW